MSTPADETVGRHGDEPPFWPPPPGWQGERPPASGTVSNDTPPLWPPPPTGWQPGAGVPAPTARRIGRVMRFVWGTVSTLALLIGGFLIVLGVAAAAQKQQGSGAAAAGVISIFFSLPFLVAGIAGWWGLRRRVRSAR